MRMNNYFFILLLCCSLVYGQNLTIASAGNLTIQKNGSLTTSGNFTNNGTVTLNSDADQFA